MRSGFVILTALLLSGSAAVAQAGKPCADDIKKLCAGIQPGEGPAGRKILGREDL